jgi:serine/threonine protein kinase
MGQVYRARDTKLDRDVALKVLPDSFDHDPDRLARFQREAKVLAALNHPNIAHIHGFEESDGVRALVMELVDGEDLAQRLVRGAIPIEEALPIAKQIAEALEAAHEQGIIHRDLKPANIKVRPDGTVKVLGLRPGEGHGSRWRIDGERVDVAHDRLSRDAIRNDSRYGRLDEPGAGKGSRCGCA